MRKSDMTLEELTTRQGFIQRLVEAGWDPKGWETLFESGARLTPEAYAEYQNDVCDLRLGYYVKDGYVLLECLARESSFQLSLRLYPIDEVETIVICVIEEQDALSPGGYSGLIQTLFTHCERIAMETPRGSVELTAESTGRINDDISNDEQL